MEFLHTLHLLRKQLSTNIGASQEEEIPWCWLSVATCDILSHHGTGLTQYLLLAELEHRWHALTSLELTSTETYRTVQPFFHRGGGGTQPALTTGFELQINHLSKLPASDIWIYQVSGAPASELTANQKQRRTMDKRMDGFVHQRYHQMIEAREFDGFFGGRAMLCNGLQAMDRNGGQGQGQGQVELTLLPTTSVAFVIRPRGGPSLPTALKSDTGEEEWLERLFGVKYQTSRFIKASTAGALAEVPKTWCRIMHVGGQSSRYREQRQMEYSWLECIEEHNGNQLVALEFWGDDARMTGLFRANDYIGLLCPQRVSRDEANQAERERAGGVQLLEYGPQTIAFVMQGIRPDSGTEHQVLSQIKVSRDERGRQDYSRYAHRVRLSQLKPEMAKLTLLARAVAISDNLRVYFEDGSYRDRYVMRIEDDGKALTYDVTLWDDVGQRAAANVRDGQLVVLKGVETREQDERMVIDGGKGIDTEVYNVSAMHGILTGQGLRGLTRLACLEVPSNVYVKGVVLGAVSVEEGGVTDARDWCGATVLVHNVCGGRLGGVDVPVAEGRLADAAEKYAWGCRRCDLQRVDAGDMRSAFSLAVQLDDGSDCRLAGMTDGVSRTLLGLAPERFLNIPGQSEQMEQLIKCMGTEVVASVSVLDNAVRIDALCLAKDVGLLSI